ncbi:MAG TPA: sugar ABC transporter permease [Gryllotalpicola sp.]
MAVVSTDTSAAVRAPRTTRARPLRSLHRGEHLWAALLLTPYSIGLLAFILIPTLAAMVLSFTNWDLLGSLQWIGFQNYVDLFTSGEFWQVVGNTAYYTLVAVPLSIAIGLGLAALLNRGTRGMHVFRSMLFLPVTVPVVASGLLWSWMMAPDYGVINYVLSFLGIPHQQWLTGIHSAMPSIILVGVWRGVGLNIVLFLAALQGVDRAVIEAASLDGAGPFRIFLRLVIPLITPTLFFSAIIGLISSFQVFDQTYIMTQGGPDNQTMTLIYYIYLQGFTFLHMGYASAISTIFTLIVFGLTLIAIRYQRLWVYYTEEG